MNRLNKPVLIAAVILSGITSCSKEEAIHPVRKTVKQAVFASGYLEQEDEYVIAATVDGTISELTIREGDSVSIDQQLLHIKSDAPNTLLREAELVYDDARRNLRTDSPQLAQIQAQIALAKEQFREDKLNYERYEKLRKSNSVSQLELEKALLQYQASESNLLSLEKNYQQVRQNLQLNADKSLEHVKNQQAILNEYTVRASKAGIVLEVNKKQGELVRKGEVIARIGSGKHRLKLFIAEDDVTKLQIGQLAIIQMNNYPDKTFTAKITRIHPAFDQSEQSYIAEALFLNPPPLLLTGTQLQANIQQEGTRKILVIPVAALLRGKYVKMSDGTERAVKTGQQIGEWIELKSGLTEKDLILLSGENDGTEGMQLPGSE